MKIVVVSPYAVPPTTHGASRRIMQLTSWLRDLGHDVHFVLAPVSPIGPGPGEIAQALRDHWADVTVLPAADRPFAPEGEDWQLDDWLNPDWEQVFLEAMRSVEPHIVLVNYIFLSKFLQWAPDGAVRILDTHDKLSRRDEYVRHGIEPGFFYTTEAEELAACARSDVVLAIQDREAEHFRSSGRPVVVIGHREEARYREVGTTPKLLGFVGAYNKFNAHALQGLAAELRSSNLLERHGAKLVIAGNLATAMRSRGELRLPPSVEARGYLADLESFYDELDVVVNPTTIGTGLKIKTVEALARGKPIVSTVTGFDGLPVHSPFHSCVDMQDLVARLEEVLHGSYPLPKLANVSRHVHAEYMLNLERNFLNTFSEELVHAHGAGRDLSTYLEARTGLLAESDTRRTISLRDPHLSMRGPRFHLAHVVNPVPARMDSDLYSAQPLTYESMRRARAYARAAEADVDLLACLVEGDDVPVPDQFVRTVIDARPVTTVGSFARPRPLPLLKDVLWGAFRSSEAEYLVYTNADIGLMPHFYAFVAEQLREGVDALVVNRRTVPRAHLSTRNLNSVYSAIGVPHPGFDCFVFRRDRLRDFVLGDVCIGVHLVGRVLLWNLLATAQNPRIFESSHVTFHLGDDNAGKQVEYLDYVEHNTRHAIASLQELQETQGAVKKIGDVARVTSPNLMSLRYSPAAMRGADGRLAPELRSRPIFIHALFRTGSSYLWDKFRRSRDHVAFYEPLHEELAYMRPHNLAEFRQRHRLDSRHRLSGPGWLFQEFESRLAAAKAGVRGYRRDFAYYHYANNTSVDGFKSYIDDLLATDPSRQVVLQMNRSALRQRWFGANYPHAHSVYLLRNPRNQWASYLASIQGEARGFSRNDAIIAGMNKYRNLLRPLNRLVWLHHSRPQGNFFAIYDAVFDLYSPSDRYTIFYYLWLQSLLEAAATGAFIVDMDSVAENPFARMRAESFFELRGAQLDLSDLNMTSYSEAFFPLSAAEMDEIEGLVQATIVQSFGMSRVRQLERSGFGEFASRLRASLGEAVADPDRVREREARMWELLTADLAKRFAI